MSDICLCDGNDCPDKESCRRFLTKGQIGDTYFLTSPYKDGQCEFYLKRYKKIPIAPELCDDIIKEK